MDLDIRPAYETLGEHDPVESFYIPALAESVSYDRSVGYFSSASLALAARGVAGLINNRGGMRLVASPHLSSEDIEEIKAAKSSAQRVIEDRLSSALGDVESLADEIERDHVRALGWMLANGYLDLRIACIVNDDGDICEGKLFHQKVGVMRDADGAALSFSGSINETAAGWMFNSEEFKVFKSWDAGQEQFYVSDERKFESIWSNSQPHVFTFEPAGPLCEKLMSVGKAFDLEQSALAMHSRRKGTQRISLFPYQREAMKKWRTLGGRLMFEMATGTGKTRTALACVQDLLLSNKKLVCVIATPQSTLSRQWGREVEALGLSFDSVVFADSSASVSREWAARIRTALSRMRIGRSNSLLVLTTHKSASCNLLLETIAGIPTGISVCLVGDEVHGMGSKSCRRALLDRYEYRIGLSATPSRWFDGEGSLLLRSYFGDESFVFGVRDAQETINPLTGESFLCPYEYHLVRVRLNDEEGAEYAGLSRKIARLYHSEDPDSKESIERLLLKRANIKKDAAEKIDRFEELVCNMSVEDMLVFTSPSLIDDVERILSSHRIAAHRFTEREGTKKRADLGGLSERDYLIKCFKSGAYQALVAIKCLDEGIDIPQAKTAVLISSSTNPREYIQRIGRVIRRSPGKNCARIYDFVVVPDWKRMQLLGDLDTERRLFERELVRIEDMRRNAVNRSDLLLEIRDLLGEAYGDQ